MRDRLGEAKRCAALCPPIRHEAEASRPQDHHRPSGRFGYGRGRPRHDHVVNLHSGRGNEAIRPESNAALRVNSGTSYGPARNKGLRDQRRTSNARFSSRRQNIDLKGDGQAALSYWQHGAAPISENPVAARVRRRSLQTKTALTNGAVARYGSHTSVAWRPAWP
jgi:hypothetical protein